MLLGAHFLMYSRDPDADRAFLRDVLGLSHVDAGEGWLIFALPASEIAVHPGEPGEGHELYLLVDDITAFAGRMTQRGLACGPVQEPRWGKLVVLTLPSGATLGVYEPRHPLAPRAMDAIAPELTTRDVERAARWYLEVLGFREVRRWSGPPFVVLERDGARLHVGQVERPTPSGFYLRFVDGVDALAQSLRDAGIEAHGPVDTPWAMRELVVRDPDGNTVRVGQPLR